MTRSETQQLPAPGADKPADELPALRRTPQAPATEPLQRKAAGRGLALTSSGSREQAGPPQAQGLGGLLRREHDVAVALGLSPDTYASILGQLNALRDGAAEARRTALDMDMMSVVGQLAAVVARSQQALRVSVELVRQQGASWTEVAALFGTSRQNAQQRFGAVAQRNAVDHAQLSLDDLLRAP